MRIRLIAAAKADMLRIWAYYEKQRPGLGGEFLDDIGIAVRLAREFPYAPPEFWKGTRRVILKRFPYGAAYRVVDDEIQVIVVAHTSRASRVGRSGFRVSFNLAGLTDKPRADVAEVGLDAANGAGFRSHHDGFGFGEVAAEAHTIQKRAVRDAGR